MDTDARLSERDRSPEPDKGEEQGSRSARLSLTVKQGALSAAACVVVVLLLGAYVIQPFLIPSGSMEKTLRIGDRVLVNKLAYRFGDRPQRGEVVVFDGTGSFSPAVESGNPATRLLRKTGAELGLTEPAETDYIKRVIGVAGDGVTCCDQRGRIEVNGVPVDEGYLYPGDTPSQVPFDIVVPDGRLWVMGDHRSRSRDSRDHLGEPGGGMVPVDRVIGRAEWIGWPYGHWAELDRPSAFARVPDRNMSGTEGGHG